MESERALTVDEREIWPQIVNIKYAAFDLTDFKDPSAGELYTRAPNGVSVPRRTVLPDAGDRPRPPAPDAEKQTLRATENKPR